MERDVSLHQTTANYAEQMPMTGKEFLSWLEQWSTDALSKSSLGLQPGVMRVDIVDVYAGWSKRALEGLADLNAHSSIRSDRAGRSSGLRRMLEEVDTGRSAVSAN
jgi:hypothetical protein